MTLESMWYRPVSPLFAAIIQVQSDVTELPNNNDIIYYNWIILTGVFF